MYALCSAIIWGIHYNIVEKIVKSGVSGLTLIALHSIIWILLTPFMLSYLKVDWNFILSNKLNLLLIAITSVTGLIATITLYKSINISSASLASAVEITFPLFVVLFGILFFNKENVTNLTQFGGLLIIIGSGIILYNN